MGQTIGANRQEMNVHSCLELRAPSVRVARPSEDMPSQVRIFQSDTYRIALWIFEQDENNIRNKKLHLWRITECEIVSPVEESLGFPEN